MIISSRVEQGWLADREKSPKYHELVCIAATSHHPIGARQLTMLSRTTLRTGQKAVRCFQCGQRRGLAGMPSHLLPPHLRASSSYCTVLKINHTSQPPPPAPSHTRPVTPMASSLPAEICPVLPLPSLSFPRPVPDTNLYLACPRVSRNSHSRYDMNQPSKR